MRSRSRRIAVLTLVPAFLAGCGDTPPTGLQSTTAGPLLQISDATNFAGLAGFYFLPPMVPDPGRFSGTFDANLSPEVRVCQLAGSECGTTIKTFTRTTTEQVIVTVSQQTYGVNWSTKDNPSSLTTNVKYRIEIRVGTQLLGFADLVFVKTSKDLGSVAPGTVGEVLGSPVNIKFRIETGIVGRVTITPPTASITLPGDQTLSAEVRDLHDVVLSGASVAWASGNTAAATVSPASGASTKATGVAAGNAVITAVAGGITASANLTVMRKPDAKDDSYSGKVGELLSAGATPAVPTLLANDDAGSPVGAITSVSVDGTDHALPLPQDGIPFAGGTLQVFADGNFSVSTTAAGQHTFLYTLTNAAGSDVASVSITMAVGSPTSMIALSSTDQTATAGTAVAEPPSVRVVDQWGNPVAGVSVTFTATVPGTIAGSPVITDVNGVATVQSWTLGTTLGTFLGSLNTIRERLHSVDATAGALRARFFAGSVAGPPASVTLVPNCCNPHDAPINTLGGGETETFGAVVVDVYGNAILGQTVDFSSSILGPVHITPPRLETAISVVVPFTLVDVSANALTNDQTLEIRASAVGRPDLQSSYTITVTKTVDPLANPDTLRLPACQLLGCSGVKTFTMNVLTNDDRGSPSAVVTRFGITPDLRVQHGWSPAGSTIPTFDNHAGSTQVTLTSDGTLTVSVDDVPAVLPPATEAGFTTVLYYELKNFGGPSLGTIVIVRGPNMSECGINDFCIGPLNRLPTKAAQLKPLKTP